MCEDASRSLEGGGPERLKGGAELTGHLRGQDTRALVRQELVAPASSILPGRVGRDLSMPWATLCLVSPTEVLAVSSGCRAALYFLSPTLFCSPLCFSPCWLPFPLFLCYHYERHLSANSSGDIICSCSSPCPHPTLCFMAPWLAVGGPDTFEAVWHFGSHLP